MLTSTLILALTVAGPTADRQYPGETAPGVPTYASPPYFPDHSQLNQTGRPVVVAGSVGPTGDLLAPLGPLSEDEARDCAAGTFNPRLFALLWTFYENKVKLD